MFKLFKRKPKEQVKEVEVDWDNAWKISYTELDMDLYCGFTEYNRSFLVYSKEELLKNIVRLENSKFYSDIKYEKIDIDKL